MSRIRRTNQIDVDHYTMSKVDKDHQYHYLHTMSKTELVIKELLLNERHRTIMEAWDDKSQNKTNITLRTMYNKLWSELDIVQQILKSSKQ
jgi:hypothetical protein